VTLKHEGSLRKEIGKRILFGNLDLLFYDMGREISGRGFIAPYSLTDAINKTIIFEFSKDIK